MPSARTVYNLRQGISWRCAKPATFGKMCSPIIPCALHDCIRRFRTLPNFPPTVRQMGIVYIIIQPKKLHFIMVSAPFPPARRGKKSSFITPIIHSRLNNKSRVLFPPFWMTIDRVYHNSSCIGLAHQHGEAVSHGREDCSRFTYAALFSASSFLLALLLLLPLPSSFLLALLLLLPLPLFSFLYSSRLNFTSEER